MECFQTMIYSRFASRQTARRCQMLQEHVTDAWNLRDFVSVKGAPLAGLARQPGCFQVQNNNHEGALQLRLLDVLPQAGDDLQVTHRD